MNSKLIKGLNVSPKIIKLLEENTGSKYFDIGLSNFFLIIVQVHFPLPPPSTSPIPTSHPRSYPLWLCPCVMWILALGICVLWLRQDKFTWTPSPVEEKEWLGHSIKESAPALVLTGFYCFSGPITLKGVLIYYAQVCFRQLQKNKGEEVPNYIKKEGYLQM